MSHLSYATQHLRLLMLENGVDPRHVRVVLRCSDGGARSLLEKAIHHDLSGLVREMTVRGTPTWRTQVVVNGLCVTVADLDASITVEKQ